MARVNNSDVVENVTDGLLLDSAVDKVPNESADKIVPVFISNEDAISVNTSGVDPTLTLELDSTANDNEKTWTIPSGKKWKILYGCVRYASTATVGNRLLRVEIKDASGNMVWDASAVNAQTASSTEDYSLGTGITRPTEDHGSYHFIPLPADCTILEDFVLEISDQNNVDSNDDMVVQFIYEVSDM